jgi:hypothetical protein
VHVAAVSEGFLGKPDALAVAADVLTDLQLRLHGVILRFGANSVQNQ